MQLRVSRSLFALGIAGSAMALGAIHTPVLLAVAAVFAIAAAFEPHRRERLPLRPSAMALVALASALLLFTAFQALPLPSSLVAVLCPRNAAVWARSLAPLHLAGPSWIACSLDPIATRIEALRGALYLLVLVGALRIASTRDGVVFLERLLFVSATLIAFAALAHPAFGASRVFGVYQPVNDIAARHIAPLLNANHLAGYVNIGICVGAGITLSPRPHIPRPIALALTVLLVGIQVWIASRGGTASMILGLALVGWMARASRAPAENARRQGWIVVGTLAAFVAAGIAVFSLSENASGELTIADLSKLRLFGQAIHLALSSPFFGVGRGAFESAFPAFRTGVGDDTFTHPENLIAQWTSEWGFVVAVIALLVIAWALRPTIALQRLRAPIGAWAALVTLAVHNQVDFSSEVPGVVVALVVCAAMVAGGTAGIRSKPLLRGRWKTIFAVLTDGRLLVPLTAVAAIFCTFGISKELDDDRETLRAGFVAEGRDADRFHSLAAAVMGRHPAEPYFPYVGEVRAANFGDESVIPWAGAVIERAPVYGRAHLALARWLMRRSPSQARLEYRLAFEQDPALWPIVASEGARVIGNYEDVYELVGNATDNREATLLALARNVGARLPSTAERIDEDLVRAVASDPGPREALAEAALADAREPSVWCEADPAGCLAKAEADVRILEQRSARTCATDRLRAQLAELRGDPLGARTILGDAIRSEPDGLRCLPDFLAAVDNVTIAQRANHGAPLPGGSHDAAIAESASDLLDRTARAVCPGPTCTPIIRSFAAHEQASGNARHALSLEVWAMERGAGDDELLANIAELASSQGLHGQAADAYRKLALRHPDDTEWRQRSEAERTGALRGSFTKLREAVLDAGAGAASNVRSAN